MTLYGATDPQVCGQPISPNFGAQCGRQYTGAPVIPSPAASPNSGPQVTLLASASNGSMPRNATATAVNGVSTGAQNPTPIDDLMGNGAGNQVNLGVATPGVSGNPSTGNVNGAIDQQQFVDGTGAQAQLVNGPTPTSVETLTSGPVSGATVVSNVTVAGFQG